MGVAVGVMMTTPIRGGIRPLLSSHPSSDERSGPTGNSIESKVRGVKTRWKKEEEKEEGVSITALYQSRQTHMFIFPHAGELHPGTDVLP